MKIREFTKVNDRFQNGRNEEIELYRQTLTNSNLFLKGFSVFQKPLFFLKRNNKTTTATVEISNDKTG